MVLFIFGQGCIQEPFFFLAWSGTVEEILFLQFAQALVNLLALFCFEIGQFGEDFGFTRGVWILLQR